MKQIGLWNAERGCNVLDSGAPFYDVYETKDGKFMAVGAIEGQFYRKLVDLLGLDFDSLPAQMDIDGWDKLRAIFTKKFKTRTRKEWENVFNYTDACVTPVLDMEEVHEHCHIKDRSIVVEGEPTPAPRLSRTPGVLKSLEMPQVGQHTEQVLKEFGVLALSKL